MGDRRAGARAGALLLGRDRAAADRDVRVGDRGAGRPGGGRIVKFLEKLPRIRLPKSMLGRAALGLPLLAVGHRASSSGTGRVSPRSAMRSRRRVGVGRSCRSRFNLLSVVARALAWTIVIRSAMTPPHPAPPLVFSAFSVGLFANAVLPGRIGELARVAVLTRKMPERKGAWATLVGTVFAHRVFDVVPVVLLVLYVVATANIPDLARAASSPRSASGSRCSYSRSSARAGRTICTRSRAGGRGQEPGERLIAMARQGLGVMRSPLGAAGADVLPDLRLDLSTVRRMDGDARVRHPRAAAAAGVVLLLMNVVTIFPFWPGNVGLVQVAIASALAGYGVAYGRGIAYGFGLQAIEASVGIGVGLLFLAREGLSMAMLRVMPNAAQAEAGERRRDRGERGGCRRRERSRHRLASRACSPRAMRRPRSRTGSRTSASNATSCRSPTEARARSTHSATSGTSARCTTRSAACARPASGGATTASSSRRRR